MSNVPEYKNFVETSDKLIKLFGLDKAMSSNVQLPKCANILGETHPLYINLITLHSANKLHLKKTYSNVTEMCSESLDFRTVTLKDKGKDGEVNEYKISNSFLYIIKAIRSGNQFYTDRRGYPIVYSKLQFDKYNKTSKTHDYKNALINPGKPLFNGLSIRLHDLYLVTLNLNPLDYDIIDQKTISFSSFVRNDDLTIEDELLI